MFKRYMEINLVTHGNNIDLCDASYIRSIVFIKSFW